MAAEPLTAVIAATASILVPVVGAIASFINRPRSQQKLQEIDIFKARLDLIEKAIKVGETVGTARRLRIDLSAIETEFLKLLVEAREAEPPRPDEPMNCEQGPFLVRVFLLPPPGSLIGWILSAAFYLFLIYALAALSYVLVTEGSRIPDAASIEALVIVLFMFKAVLLAIRWSAIRLARSQRRQAREVFDRKMRLVAAERGSGGSMVVDPMDYPSGPRN